MQIYAKEDHLFTIPIIKGWTLNYYFILLNIELIIRSKFIVDNEVFHTLKAVAFKQAASFSVEADELFILSH